MSTVTQAYTARVASGDLTIDPAQWAVLPALDALVARLSEPAPAPAKNGWLSRLMRSEKTEPVVAKGLYLWGGVGRGKSMLMDLVMDAAPTTAKRRVHFHEFMQEIQAGLERMRKKGVADAVAPVAGEVADQCRLLCFDEMQITDIADAMIVGRLFQVLFERGVVIVTTSNRVPEELYKNGLNRQLFLPFISMIRQNMDVVELISEQDHRQNRLEGGQVWFSPADGEAKMALDHIWSELTHGAATTPLAIPVLGREVVLPDHVGRIARAGFWDLCGRPLGPADYIAIAEAVDVLFIDGVPRLTMSNFNEAKRFVTLIDALYEAKVKLYASAADDPDRLYAEGEGSFEFERTASRLHEMRDADWGKAG
ncbi:cell division protein ZapE [Paracoccus aminophilus]|uniref:AFG1 family ATPase n=1 Tax=Paracoccus aminophilus JCM 7686 TaxID=1367847 RepID=S5XW89_PARAH|nr:cell division protein ZapE [Paracoccus aminophilus]AGT07655.1 AFG1 family ATPase [Paracoccus aminophilus JCM 7686]